MKNMIFILFAATIVILPLLILPLTIDYYHPAKELFGQLAVIICLALWLVDGIRNKGFYIARTRIYLPLFLFYLVSGLSLIWAKSKYLGINDYAQLLTYAAAFFICANIVSRHKDAVVLVNLAFIAGALSALYAALQYFGIDFVKYPGVNFPDWRFRLYSTFGNPDFLANYLVMVFPVGVCLYISAEKFLMKILLLAGLVIIYFAVIITFSVGAMLGLFFGITFAVSLFIIERFRLRKLMYYHEKVIPRMGRDIAALIVALSLVSLLMPSLINNARASAVWRHGLDNRILSYRAAYRMIRENPVLGVGIGNFKLRFPEYRGKILGAEQKYFDSLVLDKQRDRHVHNDLLQIWVETGIIGFILFILLLLAIYKNGVFAYLDFPEYEKKLFVLGLLGGITAFLVHSLLSFPLHIMPNGFLFWTFVGLLLGRAMTQDAKPVALRNQGIQKGQFEVGVIIMAVCLSIWPIRLYLSQVFLKRMVQMDRRALIEDALVEAESSLFFDPNSNANVYVGNFAVLNKDYDTAAESFAKALKHNNEINFHIALAEIYNQDGLSRDCIDEYLKALFLNPCATPIRFRLAELYVDNNRLNEAEAECQYLLIHNPDDESIKERIAPILKKVFEEKFFTAYGEVQVKK